MKTSKVTIGQINMIFFCIAYTISLTIGVGWETRCHTSIEINWDAREGANLSITSVQRGSEARVFLSVVVFETNSQGDFVQMVRVRERATKRISSARRSRKRNLVLSLFSFFLFLFKMGRERRKWRAVDASIFCKQRRVFGLSAIRFCIR
jgi:hypothetical protein